MRKRWIVVFRYRAYSGGKVVGETNASFDFWTRFFARRWARELERSPGYTTYVRRSTKEDT